MIDQAYIDKLQGRIGEIETELSDPATAANQKRFQTLMSEHAHLRKVEQIASRWFQLNRERNDSRQMSDPEAEKALMIALLPPRKEDSRNTIMEIRAGTGGDEAALFAAELFRMYHRYAENHGWKIGIIDANASNIGGYKEIIFAVDGKDVYRTLRYESGVHRVQRIPATEAGGRIHTSAATVAVLPEAEDIELDIKPEDIRVDIFRSSGPGGQSVNTTDSAVRLTHIPTGVVVQCQDEKSQHRNKEKAMRVLRARLLDKRRQEEADKTASDRKSQIGSGDRSERIRTYNYPQNRVTDHRINLTLYSLDRIMEGEIDELLEVLRDKDIEERLVVELNICNESHG